MRSARPQSAQHGMVLIEALVGILIFSIGILAMLGMQAVGVQTTVDAKYRSDAAFLANQIVSQMWVNQANLASYD
nr:type IV pilus modification protein PilV [Betaproteobacteria bacterium]